MEPTLEMKEEATLYPDGWVYVIDAHHDRDRDVPPEAIQGAWKVDEHGEIIGAFVPLCFASPEDLESMACCYDWDGGLSEAAAIVRAPNCDLGTALKLYWRAGAQWLTQYADAPEVPDRDLETWVFCSEVESRVKNNLYKNNHIVFDARSDDGSDHAAAYPDIPRRRNIPEYMFQPFPAPVPFSMQLLHDAIQSSTSVPESRRISSAMLYLKRRVDSGANWKEIHERLIHHIKSSA